MLSNIWLKCHYIYKERNYDAHISYFTSAYVKNKVNKMFSPVLNKCPKTSV